jgi:predicted ATPase
VGEGPRLFPVLFGLWNFAIVGGDLRSAEELARQLLTLAETIGDRALLVAARWASGGTLYFMGDFALARDHVEHGIELYDPQQHRSHPFVFPQDPGVVCTNFSGWTLWALGFPGQALARCNEGLTLAHDIAHPHTLAISLHFAGELHQFRREPELMEKRADAVIALSAERGFSLWAAIGLILRGWAVAQRGRATEGIAQIREGLASLRGGGTEIELPWVLALLAEANGKGGQAEEALNVMAEALAIATKNGERRWEAELYRVKGELLLASSRAENRTEAESCFHRAIDIARRQSAKSLELRATTSLARLLDKQGRQDEARRMLGEIYGWFTESFDTADLKDAKELLDALSS